MSNPARPARRIRSVRIRAVAAVLVLSGLLAAGLVVAGASATRSDNPVLTGDVGANDAFTISLIGPSGTSVKQLDPGTYTLVVHDRSTIHNFDLTGPGVNVSTPVEQTGDFTFTITLSDGTYTYVCDAHPTTMKGSFTVGTPAPTTTAPPPTPAPKPAATKLAASVGPGHSIALGTSDGSALSGLSAGPVTIVVRDRSKTDNFHLSGPGLSVSTGVTFRGTRTWKVTLRAGRYTYRSDPHPVLHGSFSVGS
jgi:hypothetical protein